MLHAFKTVILALCLLLGAPRAVAEPITVAAAVSLKESLTDLAARFEQSDGTAVQLVFGSSGQMAQQIRAGAPVDLYISAAVRQVDELQREGLLDSASRRDLARNQLVLIVPLDSRQPPPTTLGELVAAGFDRIALGEPRTVPAGQYAAQALENAGLATALAPRLITCTNVRQVLDYVQRGEVSVGFVYATDAFTAGGKVRAVLQIDPALHEPIVYPAAIVTDSRRREPANRFLQYLLSVEAQRRFAEAGFTPAPPVDAAPTGQTPAAATTQPVSRESQ